MVSYFDYLVYYYLQFLGYDQGCLSEQTVPVPACQEEEEEELS
jgi:hypothetical protein